MALGEAKKQGHWDHQAVLAERRLMDLPASTSDEDLAGAMADVVIAKHLSRSPGYMYLSVGHYVDGHWQQWSGFEPTDIAKARELYVKATLEGRQVMTVRRDWSGSVKGWTLANQRERLEQRRNVATKPDEVAPAAQSGELVERLHSQSAEVLAERQADELRRLARSGSQGALHQRREEIVAYWRGMGLAAAAHEARLRREIEAVEAERQQRGVTALLRKRGLV